MKALLISMLVCLFVCACGEGYVEEPKATCTAFISDLYSINCGFYDTAENPPTPIEEGESLRWCQSIETYVGEHCQVCEKLMHDWLSCRPTQCTWDSAETLVWDQCWNEMVTFLNCDCDQQP